MFDRNNKLENHADDFVAQGCCRPRAHVLYDLFAGLGPACYEVRVVFNHCFAFLVSTNFVRASRKSFCGSPAFMVRLVSVVIPMPLGPFSQVTMLKVSLVCRV